MFVAGMAGSPRRVARLTTTLLVLGLVLMSSPPTGAQEEALDPQEPTKEKLIETLTLAHEALAKEDYAAAAKWFQIPPGVDPSVLASLVRNREVSAAGIAILQKDAKFGLATDLFEPERAEAFAKRMEVPVEACYGFNHATEEATGEVVAAWMDGGFKLIRLDDVGKLEADKAPMVPQGGEESPPETESATEPPSLEAMAKRLPELAAAVANDPESVEARAQYAEVLFRLGNLPEAWKQLMEAHRLSPDHSGVARGLLTLFHAFHRQGLFTVGVPTDTVAALLGSPTKKVELGEGQVRWLYAFLAIDFLDDQVRRTIDLRGVTEASFQAERIVSAALPSGWRVVSRQVNRNNNTAIFLPAGKTLADSDRRFEISRIRGIPEEQTLESIVQTMVRQLKGAYPGLEAQVLNSADDSILVSARSPVGESQERRYQLVRFIKGPVDLHRMEINIRAEELDEETQAQWLKILQSAELKPLPEGAQSGGN